ncbi:hypothetical protein ACNKHX_27155 [Shigella flexneri]
MPTSHETHCNNLLPANRHQPRSARKQKRHFLALEAENNLPYPQLPAEARRALDEGGSPICLKVMRLGTARRPTPSPPVLW